MTRLRITTTPSQLRTQILFEAREEIDRRLRRFGPSISKRARQIFGDNLAESEAIASILGGQLRADFGLTYSMAENGIRQIFEIFRKNTNFKFKISQKHNLAFAIEITVLPAVEEELSEISYLSGKHEIEWMKWLLTKGTTIVVSGWEIVYPGKEWSTQRFKGEWAKRSRSKEAIMVEDEFGIFEGADFRVDPEFAGIKGSNFITEVIAKSLPEILLTIRAVL